MQVEDEILEAGAEIIWVLEQNAVGAAGTATDCRSILDDMGSTRGFCVGDGQTMPTPGTFDDSPFSKERGFDIIVPRKTMEVAYSTSHGSPNGNDNITGEELLAEIEAIIEELD